MKILRGFVSIGAFLLLALSGTLSNAGAEAIDCPPRGSPQRDRLKFAGEICKDEEAELKATRAKVAAAERAFKRRPLPPAAQAQVRRYFNLQMIDGESARYLWPEQRDPFVYCGFVNAKNQFGGYVGWRLFWAQFPVENGDDLHISTAGSSAVMDEVGRKACEKEGYPVYSEDVDKK